MPFDDPAQPTAILGGGGGPPPVGDTSPPAAPTGLVATAGNTQILLGWADNTETDLDRYRVYRATISGGPYTLIATVTVSDYTATGLSNGTTYYFVLVAVDDFGNESPESSQVSATPAAPPGDGTPPPVPTGLTAVAGDRQITLNWDNSPAPDFANFKIYRAPTLGGSYVLIATRIVSDYVNTGLTNGTPYFFKVSAVDTSGNESAQTSAVTATPAGTTPDVTPPAPPTGLTAAASDRAVALDWNDNGEGDLSHYRVYRSPTSGGSYTFIATRTVSNHTDGTLTNGVTYFYRVTAVDTSGNESPPSSVVSATPVAPPIPPPPPPDTDGYPTYANRQVTINVGDNINSVVSSHPAGTLFGFAPGVHLIDSGSKQFAPRGGDRFVGQTDINGVPMSILRGNWDQTQFGGGIQSPFLAYPSGVQLIRLELSRFASPNQHCAVNGGDNWRIIKVYGRDNKSGAVKLGSGSQIIGGRMFHNGQLGVKSGDNINGCLLDGVELFDNNYALWHDINFECGGMKLVTRVRNGIVRRCWAHDNKGPGLWFDFCAEGGLLEDNLAENNSNGGIFYEISDHAIIRRNIARNNGQVGDIYISNSRGLPGNPVLLEDNHVYNTVSGMAGQVGIWLKDEGTRSPRLGYVTVRRNTIRRVPKSGWTNVCLGTFGGGGADGSAAPGIVMNENRYFTDISNAWQWAGVKKTWPEWQAMGFDTIGSTSPYVAP